MSSLFFDFQHKGSCFCINHFYGPSFETLKPREPVEKEHFERLRKDFFLLLINRIESIESKLQLSNGKG